MRADDTSINAGHGCCAVEFSALAEGYSSCSYSSSTEEEENQMPTFLVQNLSDKEIRLGIEPWADLEVLAPTAHVTFEYVEPAEIEFAVLRNDRVGVSIVSDHLKVLANGHEKIFRPPPGDW